MNDSKQGRPLSEIMKTGPRKKPTPNRANKGTVESRVSTLYKLLIKGASRGDLRQIAAKWNISDRQIERYIAMATEQIEKRAEYRRNFEMGKALSRLDEIYLEAEQAGDIRGRLGVIKQVADLVGLNAAIKQELSGHLIATPEWLELRGVIIQTLNAYPEAKNALMKAISIKEQNT